RVRPRTGQDPSRPSHPGVPRRDPIPVGPGRRLPPIRPGPGPFPPGLRRLHGRGSGAALADELDPEDVAQPRPDGRLTPPPSRKRPYTAAGTSQALMLSERPESTAMKWSSVSFPRL